MRFRCAIAAAAAVVAAFLGSIAAVPPGTANTLARGTTATGGGRSSSAGRTLLATVGLSAASASGARVCSGWWCVAGGALVDVEPELSESPRLAFARPHPNPTRAALRLVYALPRPGHTRLEILDAQGRRVTSLREGWVEAGRHQVVWNGSGAGGREVPAGVYFARLLFEGAPVATHRISVVR